jgi:hypothetical protein
MFDYTAYRDEDPRHKPGASLLDVLGLVKKKNVTTSKLSQQRGWGLVGNTIQ